MERIFFSVLYVIPRRVLRVFGRKPTGAFHRKSARKEIYPVFVPGSKSGYCPPSELYYFPGSKEDIHGFPGASAEFANA
jgi:hypothetical protein